MSGELVLRGVTRRFPGSASPVLQDVTVSVPPGGCVALLGPSGSGKSTLLRLVAGLDVPDAGDVLVGGRSLAGVVPERRGTVLVFQRPRLFPHLDVLDNVAFPLVAAGLRRRRARADAERFLELVGLSSFASRRPASLSGGQEQRVALARSLTARPDVLLLDEPFSALDPVVRAEMHQLLTELRAAVEPTVLLVTHDRHEAAMVADTVAVLLDGRIAQHATVERLHAWPESLAVHTFLDGRNAVPGRVEGGFHVSALGLLALPGGSYADGPGHLVVRQEAVRVVDPDESADAVGIVLSVDHLGPRDVIRVDCSGTLLTTEAASTGAPVQPGAAVGLVLPVARRHVVPASGGQELRGLASHDPQRASRSSATL
jgi:putative spermidine/putrescine transport system ATP-binding protein